MEAVIIDPSKRGEWEEYLLGNEKSIAWQSFDWSEVLSGHYRINFFPIAAVDSGTISGVLPLYRIKTLLSGDILTSVPHAVAGGIVADNEEASRVLLGKAIELSKKFNSCRIVLKQYKHRMAGDLHTDDHYYNRELRLSQDVQHVWDGMQPKNRDAILRAEKYSMVLEYPSDDLNGFYRMLLEHLHARGIPCVSRSWIRDLIGFRMYSIALLKREGRIVAGTLVKEYKKTVSFPFSCLPETEKEKVEYLYRLYWDIIRMYCGKGYEIFHSGRIPNNDATDEHRLGWGGTKYGYYYQYFPNRSVKTEYAMKRGRKREIIEKCWTMIPTAVAGVLGPSVVKQFP
jgi:serine/alanine adding enzyme